MCKSPGKYYAEWMSDPDAIFIGKIVNIDNINAFKLFCKTAIDFF